MKLRYAILVTFMIFGAAGFSPSSALSQTRLGLHVTQEELNIWKQRAASGPYRTTGDVSSNSPGDWNRILNNANAFLSTPSSEIWAGQTSSSCWWADRTSIPPVPGRKRGEKLRDAAFAYLITGNTAYRDAARTQLLIQAATVGTNFTDGARWCNNPKIGDSYSHEIAMWLTKIIFAYSYVRESLLTSEKSTLDTWFQNAGIFWEDVVASPIKTRFPKRNNDDYTLNSSYLPNGDDGQKPKVTHFNGPVFHGFYEGWNNRNAQQIRFVTLAGLISNNTFLINQGKRYFKEWLKYAVYPDGTDSDLYRWTTANPSLGWHYGGSMIGSMVTLADVLARTGDTELYEFTTSEGLFGTVGGPKRLDKVIKMHLSYVNGAVRRYGTADAAYNGDARYLVGPVDALANKSRVHDTYVAPANLYYKDSLIKSIYTRTASGAPSYPSLPANSGEGSSWGGDWNTYPGILFMFGQMEGKVWPYPSTTGSGATPPKAPSSVIVRME